MASTIKDVVLVVSLVLSIVNLALLLTMFQSSLNLLQQQVEYKELVLQTKATVCTYLKFDIRTISLTLFSSKQFMVTRKTEKVYKQKQIMMV